MDNLYFKGELETNKARITARLEMYLFVENEVYILYCPALDLTGYGKTEEEAKNSFEYVFEIYVNYGLSKGTLSEDLKKHGWNIKSKKQKKIKAPSFETLLRTNPSFKDIAKNKDYIKYSQNVTMPEFA